MTLPENQPTSISPDALPWWGAQLQASLAQSPLPADALPLVPVKGKVPLGKAWQLTKAATVQEIAANPHATGVGVLTGPIPSSANGVGLICFDFDGQSAITTALQLTGNPHLLDNLNTWVVRRVNAAGDAIENRLKVLFRTSPEQAQTLAALADEQGKNQQWTLGCDTGEGLELFHDNGRQVVVLGHYNKSRNSTANEGRYVWAEGQELHHWASLPDEWFALAKTIAAQVNRQRTAKHTPTRKAHRHANGTSDWIESGTTENPACPICGRDTTGACSYSPSTRSVLCFHGQTFHPPSTATKPGAVFAASNGTTYAFTGSQRYDNWNDHHSHFVVHRDRSETISIPAVPQPWTVNSNAAAAAWDAALQLPEEQPASQQTVDVHPGHAALAGGITRASVEAKAKQLALDYTDGRYTDEQATDLVKLLATEAGRLEARAGQRNTISNSVKLALAPDLVGAAASGALIGSNTWRDLVKAALLDEAQLVATEHAARDMQRRQEALALAQQHNPTLAPLLRALGPGHGDHLSAPDVVALVKRLELRWNIVRRAVECIAPDGTAIELDGDALSRFYMVLAEAGHDTSKQAVDDALRMLADRNHYNPIAAYLTTLEHDATLEPYNLDRVAPEILGVTDPLAVEMVKRWLIAAVARGLRPGTKVDSMLVLMGAQGQGKSTFFEALVPDPRWFRNYRDANVKDWMITMHRCWIYEMQEVDSLNKRDAGEVKGLITINVDTIRAAYGRGEVETPRHHVMGGSCNRDDFLRDETGSRRFWVVDMRDNGCTRQQIRDAVEEHRDAIWKAALAAYREGERWWLTDEQEVELQQSNAAFEPESPLESGLADWSSTQPQGSWGSLSDILIASGVHVGDVGRISRPLQNDAAAVMRRLGWVKDRAMRKGVRTWLWAKGEQFPGQLPEHLRVQRPSPGGYSGSSGW